MKLYEVMGPMTTKLSDNQLNVLFRVFMAGGNGQGGAEAMKGNDYLLSAGEQLLQTKMIAQGNGGIVITQAGTNALKNQGIIDMNNQPTQLAQKFSSSPEQNQAPKQQPNPAQQQADHEQQAQ